MLFDIFLNSTSDFLVCAWKLVSVVKNQNIININTEYLKWSHYPFSAVTILQYSLFISSLSKTGNRLTPASTYSTWNAWEHSWGLLYPQLRCFGCYDTYRISVENRTWQCEVKYLLWIKRKIKKNHLVQELKFGWSPGQGLRLCEQGTVWSVALETWTLHIKDRHKLLSPQMPVKRHTTPWRAEACV